MLGGMDEARSKEIMKMVVYMTMAGTGIKVSFAQGKMRGSGLTLDIGLDGLVG